MHPILLLVDYSARKPKQHDPAEPGPGHAV